MRTLLLSALALVIVPVVGCGPMGSGPMPPRLEADEQKKIDDAWNTAFNPPDKLDRQGVLDALVLSQAYQVGVDRLSFRSEKKCAAGTVVMEIQFDRAKPADDRFELRVVGPNGDVIRRLTYSRTDVEATYQELTEPKYAADKIDPPPALTPAEVKKREEVQKRLAAFHALYRQLGEQPAKK
jgi:hypothetical protein